MKNKKRSKNKNQKQKIKFFAFLIAFAVIALTLLYFFKPETFNLIKDEAKKWADEQIELVINENDSNKQSNKIKSDNSEKNNIQTSSGKKSSSGTQKPTYTEDNALYFGNPSQAKNDVSYSSNYLIEKDQFSISYNSQKHIPNWVMWHLNSSDIGEADRSDDFRPDSQLPEQWYGIKKADYQYNKYGFDRGHVCPSADRTKTQEDNSITFLMTNMLPQSPNCNRGVWKDLESYERSLAQEGKELYIAAGPYGKGGISEKGSFEEIALENGGAIEVPSYCWKIIMILNEGKNDFSRVNSETLILAAFIPNNQECTKNGSWEQYLTSVDFIEEKTGFDFFAILEDSLEDTLEAKIYSVQN